MEWWGNTGLARDVREQAALDGGLTGNPDPMVTYYHDVPRGLAEEAMRRERDESSAAGSAPWPMDTWPDLPTRFALCKDDRVFPARFSGDWFPSDCASRLTKLPAATAFRSAGLRISPTSWRGTREIRISAQAMAPATSIRAEDDPRRVTR
jgi:hypothetical protein